MSETETEPADRPEFNAGDRKAVKRREKRGKQLQEKLDEAMRELMSSANGRAWIWDMLEFCHVFRTSFTGNSQTFFNEGERNVGLRVLAAANNHPELYLTMVKENNGNIDEIT